MPFLSLTIPPFLDTSIHNLIDDFFSPLLAQSVRYDRGVGYFSSGWLHVAATGMTAFAANESKAMLKMCPFLRVQYKMLRIAEEYANAGIHELRAQVLQETAQPLWNLVELSSME